MQTQEVITFSQVLGYLVPFLLGFFMAIPLILLFRHRDNKKRIQIIRKDEMFFKLIVFVLDKIHSYQGPPLKFVGYTYANGVTSIMMKVSPNHFDRARDYLSQYNKTLREIKSEMNIRAELVTRLVVEEEEEEVFLNHDPVQT